MKIIDCIGTSYLCSNFINSDGTQCSDHPLYVFKTTKPHVYVSVMFTTSQNPFTAKRIRDNDKNYFLGCSDHSREVVSKRYFQAEIYLFDERTVKLSEYKFKEPQQYSEHLLRCLYFLLLDGKKQPNKGITKVHWYYKPFDISYKEEVIDGLIRLISRKLSAKAIPALSSPFPDSGIVNCIYDTKHKLSNKKEHSLLNKDIIENHRNNNYS